MIPEGWSYHYGVGLQSKVLAAKSLSTSSISTTFATKLPVSFSSGLIFLAFLSLRMYFQKPYLLPFMSLTRFNSRWTLAFLTLLVYRIIESFRLEKTFKIIESNHKPNTARSTTKPCS